MSRVAVVTGASSGIGEATARRLVKEGFKVVAGARRVDRLQRLADDTGCRFASLDVTDQSSVQAFTAQLDRCDVLVNNAGGAKGLGPVAEADEDHWRWMWEVNVLGTMRMTRALLPLLVGSGDGHVVTVGSIAGLSTYDNGSGYTSAKHAQHAIAETLRGELFGQPVRTTLVAPGLVETEFSVVRFDGDQERADSIYADMNPLVADDVADCIAFAVTRPSHVNIDMLVVKPRDQAGTQRVHRGGRN